MNRRTFLHGGTALALAGALDAWLSRPAWAEKPRTPGRHATGPRAPASHLIVLWMNGGPSHLETWDPKPGKDGSQHRSIATRTKGLRIAEHLPQLATLSERLTVVHGLQTREGNHQRAQYLMHTGYAPNPTIEHPSMGAWLSRLREKSAGQNAGAAAGTSGSTNGLPAFVSLGGPSLSAGFLGVEHGPFVLPKAGALPANTTPPAGVGTARFEGRLGFLDAAEADFAARTGDPKIADRRELYAKAVALMRSPQLAAFDVSSETAATRTAFGDTDFGRACLTAVRLVEAGVKCIEVTLDGWDTHRDVRGRTAKLMGVLDPAMSSLLRELDRRGLADDTLVLWMGDFGRTPKLNGNEGRDHHPQSSSVVLAGGGLRTGLVHGETDATGDKVIRDAMSVPDLMATVTTRLGLDPSESLMTPIGRPIALTDHGTPVAALLPT